MRRHSSIVVLLAVLGALLAACESETIVVGQGLPPPEGETAPVDPGTMDPGVGPEGVDPAADPDAADAGVVGLTYRDEDFVEAETNRDPFRSYVQIFIARPPRGGDVQREV